METSSGGDLTQAQNELYEWIRNYVRDFQHSPSIRQMMNAMGLKSPAPIQSEYDFNSDEGQNMFIKANKKFQEASNSVGSYMGIYGLSSMVFALILVFFTSNMRVNRKLIHMFSLISGGIGFLLMYFIPISNILLLSFILIGISWGSILSMPYAMLSSSVDENKMGIMMGIFNNI